MPWRRVPGAGCPEIGSALLGAFVRAEVAAFRLRDWGTAPVLYHRANGWDIRAVFAVTSAGVGLL